MNTMRVAPPRPVRASARTWAVLNAVALFLVWMFATYLLEGRIELMRQSPIGTGRWLYVLVANVLIGTVAAAWLLRGMLAERVVTVEQLGFRGLRRSLIAIALAVVAGAAFLLLQRQVAWTPLLMLNAFALVLQTTIAEVMVCWVVLGTSVESLAQKWGRVVAVAVAIVVSNLFFAVYHYAHSAPFNQTSMVLLLLLPGLVAALVFFLGRDIFATMIVQNCLGMIGVTQAVDRAFFGRPLWVLYLLTTISVAVLLVAYVWLRRQTPGSHS